MCVISPLAELGLFLVRVDNVGRVLIDIKLLNVKHACDIATKEILEI